MKTKLFALLLAALASMEFIWASWYQVDGIYYDFNSNTKTATVTYKGDHPIYSEEYKGNIVIPSTVIFNGEIYNVTNIGEGAFQECYSLTSVSIPQSITIIGNKAFANCVRLKSLILPNGITAMGDYAFHECTGLSYITLLGETPPSISSLTFNNCNSWDFYVPCGSLDIYRNTWTAYSSRIKYSPLPYGFHLTGIINIDGAGVIVLPQTICDDTIISAQANYSYHFIQWGDGITENPRHIKLVQDTTFIAEFAKNPMITYSCNTSMGEIQGDSTLAYDSEGNITFSAIAKYGYHFTQWSDGITDNPRTIYLTKDTTFTAEFARNTYTIHTESSNSEWGLTKGDTSALYLEQVEISAIANYGYHFNHWSDYEYNSNWEWDYNRNNPRIITVYEDKTYQAIFAKNVYNISKQCDYSQGQIYGPSQAEYLNGVSLSAYPNFGYHFTQWSDGVTDNPRSFVITQDTTFAAEFALSTNGQCGDYLYWHYQENKLSFSGTGEMYNFTNSSVPWKLFQSDIKEVVFIDGMTSIGNYACANMVNLEQINIPASVQNIGDYAFANINNRKISNLVLPSYIVSVGAYAFAGNTYIERIDFGKSIESIGAYAFQNCTRVTTMTCLADVTPEVETEALASISNYAELYVLSSALRKYQVDDNWNRFLLKELGATDVPTTSDVVIEPTDNTVTITWPTSAEAETYTIEIAKDGDVFCTLIFSANGLLTGIAFAPSRTGNRSNSAALQTANGMQFTITGLNSGTYYTYDLTVKNISGSVISSYSGQFTTTGDSQESTSLNEIDAQRTHQKILRNGQIFIVRGKKMYTMQGIEIK